MSFASEIAAPPSIEVRCATPEDREHLLAFYGNFEPRPASLGLPPVYNLEVWLDRLAPQPNFLAFVEGRLAGHAVLYPQNSKGEVAVFIHQDYRGRGLGRRLLLEVIREGRRRGLHRVWGVTEADNFPMLRLASSLGFVKGESRYEFYLDLEEADLPSAAGERAAKS
jgi:ribosomal protein S18 acetylase RimI-like enzyme